MTHIPVKTQTIQASSHMIKYQVLAVEMRVVPVVAWAVVAAAAALACPAVVEEEDQVLAFFKELLQIWWEDVTFLSSTDKKQLEREDALKAMRLWSDPNTACK